MRKLTFMVVAILLAIPNFSFSQDKEENKRYAMWETIYVTPNNAKLKALGEALAHHNKTFHSEGPYTANVFNVASGPNSGKMLWTMGPCTYTDLDNRPDDDAHNDDWMNNVMPHVKKMESGEYWKMDDELSNFPEGGGQYAIFLVRYHELHNGQGYRLKDLLTKISNTIKAMEGDNPWGVFYNEFRQGNDIGRHIATVSYFNNWAEFDDDTNNFKEKFMEVNGENSWDGFIRDYDDIISNSWDEIWSHMPKLSGGSSEDDK